MIDIANCYIVAFTDEAGMVHSVPFAVKDDAGQPTGNAKATKLLTALKDIGLAAEKYGHFRSPSA